MLKEQLDEIEGVILDVSKAMGVPMIDQERKSIARRLGKYHSKELFSILMALHDKQYFPTGAELEHQVRRALGMEPAKGLSLEQIEINKAEAIRSGQSPKTAELGAEIARRGLRLRRAEPPAPAPTPVPQAEKIPLPEPFDDAVLTMDSDLLEALHGDATPETDPMLGLGDFDEDPLSGLEAF